MNEGQILGLVGRATYIASLVGIPILVVCLLAGLVVAIFEATTQIHEQAMTFVPKIVAVVILLAAAGNWMISQLLSFTREVFHAISQM